MVRQARIVGSIVRIGWLASAGGLLVFRDIFALQFGVSTPLGFELFAVHLPVLTVAFLVGEPAFPARLAVAVTTIWSHLALSIVPNLGKRGTPGLDIYDMLHLAALCCGVVILFNCLFPFFNRPRRTA